MLKSLRILRLSEREILRKIEVTKRENIARRIERKLDFALRILQRLILREDIVMATLDDVLADVTAQTDVVNSVKLVADQIIAQETAIKAELDAAIASGNSAKIQAAADALAANTANLAATRDAIAAAVVANTPAAPTP